MTAEQQRFYWTIYLQGKGLSSNGCIVVSRLGIALPYSTFKLRIGEWIEAQNRHLRCKTKALMEKLILILTICRKLRSQPHITWWDNYSKTFHKSTMRVNELDYNQNLWTVEALHFLYVDFHGAPYERSKNREGGRVSFMPDVLFDPALKQYVYDRIGKTEFEYKESLCITRDLRSSPVAAPVELSK
jgi:hypothetical protein